ncbi:MAG: thiamine pyrophosphate-dependent dehydrogenase E1 component subunit alpha [Deltaproteobacteria bacterium]|nr:thiamine pyrophosphate-dependent dehydrogenase E1 component subunit alpha [Deltaproteobacteria bacterium]MBI2229437.1 thiamine pyrophosphate-dependent dehydrogenase E1 component subunit alpha [Deltaproteobacteria bacterium]MBI2364768.1 thiamine pyrophosphate-dependent dehydrogenase E1 component subunit alpha [Deltaproteobacteria bacterium]
MMRIRCSEESLAKRYPEGEMRTPTHFSIGQEAMAVGVCAALKQDDVIYSGHRCHAHYLAQGGSLLGMVGELYGREIGCARGRGGSVHLNSPEVGVMASAAIMGETIAVAVGSAMAFAMDRSPRVAVTFFGDGCVEEGIFHESLNFAVVKKLPVLFVCENNFYSVNSPLRLRQPPDLAIHTRATSYGLPAQQVDGNDVVAVYEAATTAVHHLRAGNGPYFLEGLTYRWREHVGPLFDTDQGVRSQRELDFWMEQCPIKRASARAQASGACTELDLRRWWKEFGQEIDAVVEQVRNSPFPKPENILDGTY